MGVKMIGSHVRTNKKLPVTQAFCPEKWPAADCYNHLWMEDEVPASNTTSSSNGPPAVSAAVSSPTGLSQDDITRIATAVAGLIRPPFLVGSESSTSPSLLQTNPLTTPLMSIASGSRAITTKMASLSGRRSSSGNLGWLDVTYGVVIASQGTREGTHLSGVYILRSVVSPGFLRRSHVRLVKSVQAGFLYFN